MSFDQKTCEANRIYEEFEPPIYWGHDDVGGTVIFVLPEFKKEDVRVQVITKRVLNIEGKKQISRKKYRRFRKEFSMPPHSNTISIAPKFESENVSIKPLNNQQQNVPIVLLAEFKKGQVRVQVTTTHVFKIDVERQISTNKYRRFSTEFLIPSHFNINFIDTKFESGNLDIRIPKLLKRPIPRIANEILKLAANKKTQLTEASEDEGIIYEEFEPSSKWNHDDASDTLILMLPEFKEEQVEVLITLSPHSNTNSIAAKFEYGILSIIFPKLNINHNQQQNVPTQEPQKSQQPIIPHKPNTTEVSDQKKQQESKKDEEEKPKQNGKAKELTKDDDDVKNKVEKRSETTRQRYVNLLLLVLMFGLYVKSVIKSIFSGGHKSQEL